MSIILQRSHIWISNSDIKTYPDSSDSYPLPDIIYAHSSSEINGETTLNIRYLLSGSNAEQLAVGKIIYTKINDWQPVQKMRIRAVKTLLAKSQIEVIADHISNDLRRYKVPYTRFNIHNPGPMQIWDELVKAVRPTINSSNFRFSLQAEARFPIISRITHTYLGINLLEFLGGTTGSILDLYGGEIERDNTVIRWRDRFGSDRGAVLKYGLNMKDIEMTIDISNTYYGVFGFVQYTDDESISRVKYNTTTPITIANPTVPDNLKGTEVITLDVTNQVEAPTATISEIQSQVNNYISSNKGKFSPSINMKIDFISLKNKKGYEQFTNLFDLRLGDDVQIIFPELGLNMTTRIISYEYDILTEQYTKLELGQPKSTFLKQLNDKTSSLYRKIYGINQADLG